MASESLIQLLKLIESLTLLSYGLSFALIYRAVKLTQHCYSTLLSMMILVLFNLMMLGYMELLWWLDSPTNPSRLVNFFWYIGFSLFYLAGILTIYYVHKKENTRIGRFGQLVSTTFCAAAILQLAAYTEIVLFQTIDKIGNIYTYGIPAINILTAIIALLLSIYMTFMVRYKPQNLARLDQC